MATSTLPIRTTKATATPMTGSAHRHFVELVRGDRRGLAPALQRLGLRLAAVPYGLAVRVRNLLYDRGWRRGEQAAVAVVSVGNLTVGGTGKTPCVEYLANYYRERDLRVAILSRGYGAVNSPNDEALLLEENLPDIPHLQGADRAALARTAVAELDSEVLVLDDAFQHRRLRRDLDLVLVDATCPWGFGHLLPRGLLREPRGNLRRAHAVLLTRCDQVGPAQRERLLKTVRRLAPQTTVVEASHEAVECLNADRETASLERLSDGPVAAFCGVGNPESFRRTLTDRGADIRAWRTFPDHHPYSRSDVHDLNAWASSLDSVTMLVTTQKDLVKLRLSRLGGRPLWCVRVRLRIEAGQAALHHLLDAALRRGQPADPLT